MVHALQVFNFLLYINIEFPDNVEIFAKYLAVASGDVEELNQYIPTVSDYIINQDDVSDTHDDDNTPDKFKQHEIPPYFLIAFG